jgi:putative hydrolase of the HAD superfamily
MLKFVFFDFFNTLVRYDPPPEQLHRNALNELGLDADTNVLRRAIALAEHYFYEENRKYTVMKRPLAEQQEVMLRYEEKVLEEAGIPGGRTLAQQVDHRIQFVGRKASFALFDDAISSLAAVRSLKLKTGLISNIPQEKLPVLDILGLAPLLDVTVTPYDAGADKPDPAIFRAALRKAGVEASEAIHVGDQHFIDVEGALGAGLGAILLDRPGILPNYRTCPRVSSLSEVPALLSAILNT